MFLRLPLHFSSYKPGHPFHYKYDSSEALVDRLSERASIPELEALKLPDDWRADQTKDPEQWCTTCHWNGRWDQLLRSTDSRPQKYQDGLRPQALKKSAADGNLCRAILLALSRKFDIKGDESEWSTWASVYFDWFGLSMPDNSEVLEDCFNASYIRNVYLLYQSPLTETPQGASVYPHGDHPSIDPRSDRSLAWANKRIRKCDRGHKCHEFQSDDKSFPTRLVYITKDAQNSRVWLIRDPADIPNDARYAALSHCWGDVTPPCLTTVHNIDKYATEGIPWAQVPRTFQDAMLYSRRLDLEYIWIDSICIVQGDNEDWKLESTRMFQSYSNAHVMLASTFSANCHGGLFSERHINAARLYLLDVQFRGHRYPVYASRYIPQKDSFDDNEKSNDFQHLGDAFQLLHRAWIYQ